MKSFNVQKKFKTLFTNPKGVLVKYSRKFWKCLTGHIPPISGEDYDKHWNYVSFDGKTVLDLGADYGSTADYFLFHKAERVIAVEGDKELACKLRRNFKNDKRVICIEKWIGSGKDISQLIERFQPNIVKVDIEGEEKCLLDINVETLLKVKEWLIETHTPELHNNIKEFFKQNGFKVSFVEYGKTLNNPQTKVLIAKRNRTLPV